MASYPVYPADMGPGGVGGSDMFKLQAPAQTAIIFTKDTERALRQLIREEIANAMGHPVLGPPVGFRIMDEAGTVREVPLDRHVISGAPPAAAQDTPNPEVDLWAEIVRVGRSQG